MARTSALVLAASVSLAGCGSAPGGGIASAPAASWSASLLGQPADILVHVGVGQLLADPVFGASLAHAISTIDTYASDAYPVVRIDDPRFYATTVVDAFATVGASIDDASDLRVVTVIRGVPSFDPRALRSHHGETDLSPNVRTFPSGVSEFLSGPRAKRFVLYVMPDHATWVITDDVTAARAGPYFWSNGAAPPPAVSDGSLATLFVGPRVLNLAYVLASRRGVPADGFVGMTSAALSLRPGPEATVDGRFAFDTDAHALALGALLDPSKPCFSDACKEPRALLADTPTRTTVSGSDVATTTVLPVPFLRRHFSDRGSRPDLGPPPPPPPPPPP